MVIVILLVLLLAVGLGVVYLYGKKCKESEGHQKGQTIFPSKVEELLAKDFQDVILSHGQETTHWYCTSIELTDYLDSGNQLDVSSLSNVFQNVYKTDDGADTFVITYKHTKDHDEKSSVHDFWIEDNPLDVLAPRISFVDALENVYESNYPKPHSKQCVLRNQVGPKAANAQYIFGNTKATLFVDSVTGEVSNKNPFFNN